MFRTTSRYRLAYGVVHQIEIDVFVDLSPRQRALYAGLLANVSVSDLLEKAANIGDADSARSLMNLVMQFRKVSGDYSNIQANTDSIAHRYAIILSSSSEPTSSPRFLSVNTENPDRSIVKAIS